MHRNAIEWNYFFWNRKPKCRHSPTNHPNNARVSVASCERSFSKQTDKNLSTFENQVV